MRGFIINIRKAKNEDVIVTVLSNEGIKNYWRFFGTRHSILQIGNLIDFEVKEGKNNFMPSMRSLSQHSFPWIYSPNHLALWQNLITLFHTHLKDYEQIEIFYFELLMKNATKWEKQNPKRLAIESYVKLLNKERRLYNCAVCHLCENILEDEISLIRAFIPVHKYCSNTHSFQKRSIIKLFHTKSTIHINDKEVNALYKILLKGL